MTRKDTILIAVIINTGLLAVLFATAIIYDSESDSQQESGQPLAEAAEIFPQASNIAVSNSAQSVDEVDNVLKYYSQPQEVSSTALQQEVFSMQQTPVNTSSAFEDETSAQINTSTALSSQDVTIDVIVKKGDSLDKIARANGTTIAAIKKASNLQSEKLSIGQVLKVPLKKEKTNKTPASRVFENKETASNDVYYTIKSGDSPWKIAKQFNVSTDEILKLNNLDEAKARNLKAGDRIRVK